MSVDVSQISNQILPFDVHPLSCSVHTRSACVESKTDLSPSFWDTCTGPLWLVEEVVMRIVYCSRTKWYGTRSDDCESVLCDRGTRRKHNLCCAYEQNFPYRYFPQSATTATKTNNLCRASRDFFVAKNFLFAKTPSIGWVLFWLVCSSHETIFFNIDS